MMLLLLLLLLLLMRSLSNELVRLLSGLGGGGCLKSFDVLLVKDMLLHHWLGSDELG
jgi:hypothetical protein